MLPKPALGLWGWCGAWPRPGGQWGARGTPQRGSAPLAPPAVWLRDELRPPACFPGPTEGPGPTLCPGGRHREGTHRALCSPSPTQVRPSHADPQGIRAERGAMAQGPQQVPDKRGPEPAGGWMEVGSLHFEALTVRTRGAWEGRDDRIQPCPSGSRPRSLLAIAITVSSFFRPGKFRARTRQLRSRLPERGVQPGGGPGRSFGHQIWP